MKCRKCKGEGRNPLPGTSDWEMCERCNGSGEEPWPDSEVPCTCVCGAPATEVVKAYGRIQICCRYCAEGTRLDPTSNFQRA